MIIKASGWGPWGLMGQTCRLPHHSDNGAVSDTGWEVYPPGLRLALEKFSRLGVPLLVTENGIATSDETLRRKFILQHLQSLAEAHKAGVDVIGYLYWSLLDNYEWAMGRKPRFGLAAVDSLTLERRERPSSKIFKMFAANIRCQSENDNFS